MTTLTKVFIVLLAVFAIAFSMLVIQYTAHTTNWKERAESRLKWVRQAQAARTLGDSQHDVAMASKDNEINDLKKHITNLRNEFAKLTTDMTTMKEDLLARTTEVTSLNVQVNQFAGMFKAADAERKQLQKQLTDARKQITGLQSENFKLAKLNQELELTKLLYEKEIQLLNERNFSLSETLVAVRRKVRAADSGQMTPAEATEREVGAVSAASAVPILGQVTQVADRLASVSVGSAHGVKPGMEFVIYRGSQYLGKLTITKVLPDEAAGELRQLQGVIRQGDKVTDKF